MFPIQSLVIIINSLQKASKHQVNGREIAIKCNQKIYKTVNINEGSMIALLHINLQLIKTEKYISKIFLVH